MEKLTLILFVLFAFFTLSSTSFAQLEIKPAIGMNFTGFSQDPENVSPSAQAGWQIGATVSGGEKLYGEGGVFWVSQE